MRPSKRLDMREKVIGRIEAFVATGLDGMAEMQGVPIDDDGGEQIETGDLVMLTLGGAVADLILPANAMTYADDLVILWQEGNAQAALDGMRKLKGNLKLTVNEDKTRICKVPDEAFDLLDYTFGRMYSAKTGRARIGYRPSKKNIERAVDIIHALTERRSTWRDATVPYVAGYHPTRNPGWAGPVAYHPNQAGMTRIAAALD